MEIYRKGIIGGILVQALSGISLSMFMTYIGIYLEDLAATALVISAAFLLRNVVQIFIRVPLAELSQIIGRKPLILSGMSLYTLAFLFMWRATSWESVLFATILIAFGMSCYYPAIFAYIGDLSETSNNYGKINGVLFLGSDFGLLLSTLIATILLDSFAYSLENLFFIVFITGIVGVIISFFILPEVMLESEKNIVSSKVRAFWKSFVKGFRNLILITQRVKNLKSVYSFQLVISYAEYFIGSFLPLLLVISKGFNKADVAFIFFVSTILIIVFKPFLGSLSDKFGYKIIVQIGLTINILLIILIVLSESLIAIIVIYSFYRMGSIMSYMAVNGASSNLVTSNDRGLVMGGLGFYVSFGRSASSLILAPIWNYLEQSPIDDSTSLEWLFYISASVILLVTIFVSIKFNNPKLLEE